MRGTVRVQRRWRAGNEGFERFMQRAGGRSDAEAMKAAWCGEWRGAGAWSCAATPLQRGRPLSECARLAPASPAPSLLFSSASAAPPAAHSRRRIPLPPDGRAPTCLGRRRSLEGVSARARDGGVASVENGGGRRRGWVDIDEDRTARGWGWMEREWGWAGRG